MEQSQANQNKGFIFSRYWKGFLLVNFCLLGIIITLLFKNYQLLSQDTATGQSWNADKMRDYANRLKSEGLVYQAVRAFEEYIDKDNPDGKTRSNIYYSLGEILLKDKQYEDAVSYFYKAEIAYPETPLKKEIGTYVVNCLENMGKSLDAQYQLESRAALKGEEKVKKASGEVIARIENREITMGEINQAIERLPGWVKEQYVKSEPQKIEFVKQYIFNELLYEKGLRLGINKEPEIREQIEDFTKQLIAQKIISQEVFDKIKSDPEDLKNYYIANKQHYQEKPCLKFRHILVEDEKEANKILEQVEKGEKFEDLAKIKSKDELTRDRGGAVSEWIYETGDIAGVGEDEVFRKKLFEFSNDRKFHVLKSDKGFHVIQIIDNKEAKIKDFEQVQEQVKFEYDKKKAEALSQELLQNLLKTKEVEIFNEKFVDQNKKENDRKEKKEE